MTGEIELHREAAAHRHQDVLVTSGAVLLGPARGFLCMLEPGRIDRVQNREAERSEGRDVLGPGRLGGVTDRAKAARIGHGANVERLAIGRETLTT